MRVHGAMQTYLVLVLIVVASAVASRDIRSCGSCGMECETACGTRNFKTCCFNYMKKRSEFAGGRSNSQSASSFALDPSLRLELWLARSRAPLAFYQRLLQKQQQEQQPVVANEEDDARILSP